MRTRRNAEVGRDRHIRHPPILTGYSPAFRWTASILIMLVMYSLILPVKPQAKASKMRHTCAARMACGLMAGGAANSNSSEYYACRSEEDQDMVDEVQSISDEAEDDCDVEGPGCDGQGYQNSYELQEWGRVLICSLDEEEDLKLETEGEENSEVCENKDMRMDEEGDPEGDENEEERSEEAGNPEAGENEEEQLEEVGDPEANEREEEWSEEAEAPERDEREDDWSGEAEDSEEDEREDGWQEKASTSEGDECEEERLKEAEDTEEDESEDNVLEGEDLAAEIKNVLPAAQAEGAPTGISGMKRTQRESDVKSTKGTIRVQGTDTDSNYTLPSTGGSGLLSYKLGGLSLVLLSSLFFFRERIPPEID